LPTETQKVEGELNAAATRGANAHPSIWQEQWLELPGGRMRYLMAGSGSALILVHGLLGYAFSWRFTIPALAQSATVYAIDNLGAGLSTSAAGMDCSLRASAERVLAFVDALAIPSFDLLGTSHGGAVAMMAAAICAERRDARLKRLALVAPVNPWSPHGRWLAPFLGGALGSFLFRHTIERCRFLDYLWLRRLFGDGAKIPPDSLEGYRVPVRTNHGFRYGRRILQTWTADLAALEQVLPTIRDYPTLLMWGTRDRAVSVNSAEPLRRNFRDGRLVVFQGVGHLPYEEASEEFNRALIEFLIQPE
jgi:4,5:9,10-diseco-3-hydroxy-5,9,17-trioxoandrosta-1(10),2-diene-4-oate hydrolase